MKPLLIALTICPTLLIATLPSYSQTSATAPAEVGWEGYFQSLKVAVTKHDKRALKALVASRIHYEDGTVPDTQFLEDFESEAGRLGTALSTGTVTGNGAKRHLRADVAEIDFVFAKGKWYLKIYNVSG